MQDKVNGPKIVAFAKQTHNEDLLKFLTLMKAGHKGKNGYDLFIKRGALYELNLEADVRQEFDTVAARSNRADLVTLPRRTIAGAVWLTSIESGIAEETRLSLREGYNR
jgi:hypothetical protein